MKHQIDAEFIGICNAIFNRGLNEKSWETIESSDMFQTEHYCGGYEATEKAFCFSFYDACGKEWWFQVTPDEIYAILKKDKKYLTLFETS